MQRLSALIVNYESGAYALALAASLQQAWRALGRAARELEIAVVDNASPSDQSSALGGLRELGAQVVQARSNLGYAAGMNLALAATRGEPDDLVLVLNPDIALFAGSLGALLEGARESSGLGALGPRAFLDPSRTWRMPPNRLPTPESDRAQELALHDEALAARLCAERTRHALREWTAREPTQVEMLSGACLLLPRSAIQKAGGLFDERYPLYYEDTDLFQRLTRAGLALLLDPRAEIVHHWARSSGIESQDPEPARRLAISRAAYFARWSDTGEPATPASSPSPAAGIADRFQSLGAIVRPPLLEFPHGARWLVELAMLPSFPLAAGAIVEGNRWRMDERAWEWFYRGRYFVRAVDLADSTERAAWTFDKPSPARTAPLEPRELEAPTNVR
ncbi:MAG: glycosyltransferase [Planctomycetota bacterium]